MHNESSYSYLLASKLLQINAIKLNTENLFTWASGIKSPIYCDNRRTLAYPQLRDFIRQGFCDKITQEYPDAEYIAGVATGAIALGALVADTLQLPYLYVRPQPKAHGLENQIEGVIDPGKKVVVIEDLVSTGGSSIKAVEALRKGGYNVLGLVAIFTYGFAAANNAFALTQCPFSTLTNYDVLIDVASKAGYISVEKVEYLNHWRNSLTF